MDLLALTALLDGVGAYVFAKDREGRYTYANAPMLQFLGRRAEDLLGRRADDLVDLAHSPHITEHDRRVLEQGETVEGEESNLMRMDGRRRIFWTAKRPLRDAQGVITGLVGVSTDITERKAIEARLEEQRQLLHAVLDNLDAFVYMKDVNRRYRYINERVARNLGIKAQDVVGKLDSEVLPRELADHFWLLDRAVFETGLTQSAEETHVDKDGVLRHHWSIKVPVRHEGVPALIGFSTDISELVRLREQLRQQASSDPLTGLANRRQFTALAETELARARRHGDDTALLLIDIDHFKAVNDRFGHPQGDAVLCRVGELLRDSVRAGDCAARVGGEEFAVLLPRTQLMSACLLAERLRTGIATNGPMLRNGECVTVSVGLACCGSGALTLEQLYAAADALLYRAKQNGRNRVET
jgi:diguanylate cyclase (GGDEF)-like protein/PAS domain S-box-containing protein